MRAPLARLVLLTLCALIPLWGCDALPLEVQGTIVAGSRLRVSDYNLLTVWASTSDWLAGACPEGEQCTTGSVELGIVNGVVQLPDGGTQPFPFTFSLPLPEETPSREWLVLATLTNFQNGQRDIATAQLPFELQPCLFGPRYCVGYYGASLVADFPVSTTTGRELWPSWYCGDRGGAVVADSGAGETSSANYRCSSGQPPLASVYGVGVCCAP